MAVFKSFEEGAHADETSRPRFGFLFTSREQVISIENYAGSPFPLTGMGGKSITPVRAEKLSGEEFRVFTQDGAAYICVRKPNTGYRVEVFLEKPARAPATFVEKAGNEPYRPPSIPKTTAPAAGSANLDSPLIGTAGPGRDYFGISVQYDPAR